MLLLANTTDKIQVVTASAGSVDAHSSYMDSSNANPPVVQGSTSGRTNAAITTAATTDLVPAPGSSTLRNVQTLHIRNKHATVSNDVTILYNQNGTTFELHKATLAPGEALEYVQGIGFFEIESPTPVPLGTNFNMTATAAGFATDTYISGSALDLDALGSPRVGRRYSWRLLISKTAAGTATPVITVRVGTAGTTGDTARATLTWGAGTANADRGEIEMEAVVTATGASGQIRVKANWTTNLTTTGLSNAVKTLFVQSGSFDLGVANSLIGLSYNGGTSAAHTIEWVTGFTDDL